MRPERLLLDGFTAFREPAEVDFAGADLFALAGPTGAGKSSLIDAMIFALYGSVPRLSDRRAVSPVISQGLLQARVQLDFSVGGVRYTAVRVVGATKAGATTREARLERRDDEGGVETLAGDADGVTAAVEELLGLSFEHFCTCVVLPQGEFAALLHAKPSKRQDMLLALLDLGLYERMGQEARTRAMAAQSHVAVLDGQLETLADASDEAVAEAERRVGVLDKLVDRIDEARPRLEELTAAITKAKADVEEATSRVAELTGLAVPADVAALATKAKEARAELDLLIKDHQAAEGFLEQAEAATVDVPDRVALRERLTLLARRAEQAERILNGETIEQERANVLGATVTVREEADAAYAQAQVAMVGARDRNVAASLAHDLVTGAPCPVCQQVVRDLPHHDDAPDVAEAERTLTSANAAMQTAHDAERAAQREHDKASTLLDEVRQTVAELDERLGDGPDAAAIEVTLSDLDRREADLRTARETEKQRRRDREGAERRARDLAGEEQALWTRFDEARDRLAALGPPSADRSDLGGAWSTLVAWADEVRPAREEQVAAARAVVEAAEVERTGIDQRIRETCAELDVVVGTGEPRDAATEAREKARTRAESLVRDREKVQIFQSQRAGLVEQHQVAEELGSHLRANRFEKWILDEALQRLVVGATEVLRELSAGAYSLTLDGKGADFAVVDHANADAVRGAKTLSGGETFLASLALALALADQVADLAADGSARLESIFCDEGFGSLDLDTLDVVATALEELGASGRMVGVVSHVRELAERLPVRFEVRKGPTTSTVTRVDA
jgi:DNA repair protein SbcC/Rad50